MTLCNHWFFPGDGDLEVLIKVECGDREIIVAFGDVVDGNIAFALSQESSSCSTSNEIPCAFNPCQ